MRSLLFSIIAFATLLSPAWAEERSCVEIVNDDLHFDLVKKARIKDGVITVPFSVKNKFSVRRGTEINTLSSKDYSECAKAASEVRDALFTFAKERLEYLLLEKNAGAFHTEAGNLAAALSHPTAIKDAQEKVFTILFPAYLALIRQGLNTDLYETPWSYYATVEVVIEAWNPEWKKRMGREAPAGSDFKARSIALRPLTHTPDELKIFLFHELSHLMDPLVLGSSGSLTANQLFANELYAWRQTKTYIDLLIEKKHAVPELFMTVHRAIELRGFEAWVRDVFETVHPDLAI